MPLKSRIKAIADYATRSVFSYITRGRRWGYGDAENKTNSAQARLRLTFVQFGDYRETFERFRNGGAETYYAQRYTVDYVESLAELKNIEAVCVINLSNEAPMAELSPGLWCGAVQLYPPGGSPATSSLLDMVAATRPTHLIVSSPFAPLIRFGVLQNYQVLPIFADSFSGSGLKQRVYNARLAWVLSDPRIPVIGNHNLAASLDLIRIGVDPEKVVPYDWPALISPHAFSSKLAPAASQTFRFLYVGMLNVQKGVGDLIQAIAELRKENANVALSLIGVGDEEEFKTLSIKLNVCDRVKFLGKCTHAQVQAAMREHDAIVVPSRHTYPEGLPMTLYEALCSRTPILASDHPMFALRIRDGFSALVFRAESPANLALRARELMSSPKMYEELSRNAEAAAKNYLCPLKWDRLLTTWLEGDTNAILMNSIASIDAGSY